MSSVVYRIIYVIAAHKSLCACLFTDSSYSVQESKIFQLYHVVVFIDVDYIYFYYNTRMVLGCRYEIDQLL